MQRTMAIAVGLLLPALSLTGSAAPKELADLQGKWKITAIESDEREVDLPDDLPLWEIKEEKILYGREELAVLTIDATVDPKTVDLKFHDPMKEYEGIYSLEADTLRICVNNVTDGVKQRPTGLTTKDHPSYRLLVLKRATAEDAPPSRGYVGIALALRDEAVVINGIIPDSPAKKADLREGDVLVKIAGAPATDLQSTVAVLRKAKPGSELAIAIRRDGKDQEIKVTAGVFPFRFFGILE